VSLARILGRPFAGLLAFPAARRGYRTGMEQIEVRSSTIEERGRIPDRHSHDGPNVPPAIEWIGVPKDAAEIVLMCEDPDAPRGTFLHWLMTGIHPHTGGIPEGRTPDGGHEWSNDFGEQGWGGPAPPPGDGPHRYLFEVYALAQPIDLPDRPTAENVHRATEGITMAQGTLVGLYER
jgi:Raf kinase inhibitor-like YbhB/YbcL family protein